MPQTIQVPNLGPVEFPDGMSDDEIASAIESQTPEPELRPMSFGEKLRSSPFARKLFGPTQAEREGMAGGVSGSQMGVMEIPEAMLHLTNPGIPPVRWAAEKLQGAEDAVTTPLINLLPEPLKKLALVHRGALKGVREFALDTPLAPIPGFTKGKAALAALSAFGVDFLANQPEVYRQFKDAVARGDVEAATKIAASDVAGGALLGLGAKHGVGEVLAERRAKAESPPPVIEPPLTENVEPPVIPIEPPLNPGGPVADLPPELQARELENATKQRQIAEAFKKSLEPPPNELTRPSELEQGGEVTENPFQKMERNQKEYARIQEAATNAYKRVGDGNEKVVNEIADSSPLKEWIANDGAEDLEPKNLTDNVDAIVRKMDAIKSPSTPEVNPETAAAADAPAAANVPKEPWQMTQAERLSNAEKSLREKDKTDPQWVSDFLGNQKIYHRNAVKAALKEGKPVPPEVLADYQDLKPTNVPETVESVPLDPATGNEVVKPIGMGGAVASEFEQSPKTPTGIKNATVDKERVARGLPPAIQPARRSFGKVWDETMARVDHDPGYQDRLISELRDKPRALTDSEDAALLHRQIDLQNEYGKATRDLAQAFDDGRVDAVQNEKARVAALSDQLFDLYDIGKKVGTETGRGLNARKMMAYEDFTLAKMEMEKRAQNDGAPLDDAQKQEVVRLNEHIQKTQKAFDDYVAKTDSREAERLVNEALDQAKREASKAPPIHPRILVEAERVVKLMEGAADAARVRLREKFSRTSAGVDPTILADLSIVGAAKIARGVVEFGKWSDAMLKDIGEGIKPFLQEAWTVSNKQFDESVNKLAKKDAPQVKRVAKSASAAEKKASTVENIKTKISGDQRAAITPDVQKLARLLVEEGYTERNALIDAVHEVLKEADPEITRREAMDAISGYGEFRQISKDEISKKLRDLKGQMQQVAKLEDMQSGRPPLKTGMERRIPSSEESRLIKLVNQAKNEFQIPLDDPNTQLKSSLDTLKTRLKNTVTELEGRLQRGDFEKKPKRIIQMDAEANRLHYEATKAKAKWHEALMHDRLAKRSIPAKIFAGVGEVLNTSRAILTSMDLSAVLRQGGFIAFGHPVRAVESFPAMFRAFRSEAGQHAVNQEIQSRKNYPLYNQAKLYLSEHGHKLSHMEEAYMSRWADKIPFVAGSQRAYVTFLNKLRADSFDAMANSLARNKELTPVEANAIANFINVSTGRGNLGMKENALVGLNTVFFAPRYVASRFQLLFGQPLYRGSARTRIAVAKEYGRYLIGVGLVYALAQKDGAEIETDPRSADFGKLKYGHTRVDPLSGLLQTTVLLSRLATGEVKTAKGKVVPIRGKKVPFGGATVPSVTFKFLRSKLSPAIGTILNILSGEDVVGQPVTTESTIKSLTIPLAFQDIYKTMQEQGLERGTIMAILSLFGMGLQNYDEKQKPK